MIVQSSASLASLPVKLAYENQYRGGLLRGEIFCFPTLTSTDYTPRDIKIFFKNSRFQTRGVYFFYVYQKISKI